MKLAPNVGRENPQLCPEAIINRDQNTALSANIPGHSQRGVPGFSPYKRFTSYSSLACTHWSSVRCTLSAISISKCHKALN